LYKENDEGSAWVRIKEGGRVAKFVEGREEVLEKVYEVSARAVHPGMGARDTFRLTSRRALSSFVLPLCYFIGRLRDVGRLL
jgi:hypothetical protein